MSSDESSDRECPLCMEPLDFDDVNFYPCTCQYQICRFCWHRLRTDENGLCPACRQPYPENPVNFQPVSGTELQKFKTKTKQRQPAKTKPAADTRKHLAEYRVLQKNLVYVVGLSHRLADAENLKKPEFFGRFGRILKVVVGTSSSTNSSGQTSCTAYVTYAREDDALKAISGVNNAQIDGRCLKASLGTTKYCSTFLRGQTCTKTECMYLHEVADEEISFTKEDMHAGKHNDFERKLQEQLTSRMQNVKAKPLSSTAPTRIEPSTSLSQTDLSLVETSSTKENNERNEMKKATRKAKILAEMDSRKSSPKPDPRSRPTSRASSSASFVSSKSQSQAPPIEVHQQLQNGDEWEVSPSDAALLSESKLPEDESETQSSKHNSGITTCGEVERLLRMGNQRSNIIGRENGATNGHNNNFDDDLGFDPFSISAKALADMVIEEKELRTTPAFNDQFSLKSSHPTGLTRSVHDSNGSRSSITLNDLFTSAASRTPSNSSYSNLNAMATGLTSEQTNGHMNTQTRLFQRQSAAPHLPQQQPYGNMQSTPNPMKTQLENETERSSMHNGNGYNVHAHENAHADYLRLREFAAQIVGNFRDDVPMSTNITSPSVSNRSNLAISGYGMLNGLSASSSTIGHSMGERYEMAYETISKSYQTDKPNGSLNLNEYREEFKALLPNVNVRFVSSDEPNADHKLSVGGLNNVVQPSTRNSTVNSIFHTYGLHGNGLNQPTAPMDRQIPSLLTSVSNPTIQPTSNVQQTSQFASFGSMVPPASNVNAASMPCHDSTQSLGQWIPPPPGFAPKSSD
ncbi:hypothetical protein M3Y96_00921700 [Aphelenchoides besseyi]|nr:hypothetical protein M3Y96_00921700 [Aphelenchoides besseyi]